LEVRALAQAGATVIQVDEPAVTVFPGDEPLASRALAIVFEGISGVTKAAALYHGPQKALVGAVGTWPVDQVVFDCVSDPGVIDQLAATGFPKAVGLGLLSARNTKLEKAADVAAQVARVTKTIPADRVSLSPSCGLEFLPRDRARQKLTRLVESAKVVQTARLARQRVGRVGVVLERRVVIRQRRGVIATVLVEVGLAEPRAFPVAVWIGDRDRVVECLLGFGTEVAPQHPIVGLVDERIGQHGRRSAALIGAALAARGEIAPAELGRFGPALLLVQRGCGPKERGVLRGKLLEHVLECGECLLALHAVIVEHAMRGNLAVEWIERERGVE